MSLRRKLIRTEKCTFERKDKFVYASPDVLNRHIACNFFTGMRCAVCFSLIAYKMVPMCVSGSCSYFAIHHLCSKNLFISS